MLSDAYSFLALRMYLLSATVLFYRAKAGRLRIGYWVKLTKYLLTSCNKKPKNKLLSETNEQFVIRNQRTICD